MYAEPFAWAPLSLWVLSLAQLVALGFAAIRAPWSSLRRAPERLHLLLGTVVCLILLWSIGGRLGAHASMHLLGMTTATLLLGPALAVLAGSTAMGLSVLMGKVALTSVLANSAIVVSLPVLVTAGLLRGVLRYAPRNLFAYMLGVGFFGGALSMLAVVLATLFLLALSGDVQALHEWLSPLMLLAMFPEGFVNGAVVSGLAVYHPEWLRTLDERHFML